MIKNSVKFAFTTLFVAITLSACGGGSNNDGGSNNGGGSTGETEVTKTAQNLTGLPIATQNAGTEVSLPQNTSANLSVTYTSTTPTTCFVKNNYTLVFAAQGQCSVNYSQAGNQSTLPLGGKLAINVLAPIVQANGWYDVKADIQNCKSSTLSDTARNMFIAELDEVRKLHGLQPLAYDKDLEPIEAETALAMAAGNNTSHYIDSSWACYSDLAEKGAKLSSLINQNRNSITPFPYSPNQAVQVWVRELWSTSLGHRRWMLNPFIKKTAYGMAEGVKKLGTGYTLGASMFVYDPATYSSESTDAPLGIYPYPVGNYPRKFFQKGDRLSVFVLADQSSSDKNRKVDYSKATVSIKDTSGKAYTVSDILFDNYGQGVPNNLSFLLPDFDYNIDYTINIDNVLVNGETKNYQYSFNVN